jgi:hypothetical protein
MKKKSVLIIIALATSLIFPLCKTYAYEASTLDISLSAFTLQEVSLISRGASTTVAGHFKYLIDDNIKLSLWPVASFLSGQQASRDPQNPLMNSILLKEASAGISLGYNTLIKLGTLYQKDYLPGIAGDINSFPAAALVVPYTFNSSNQIIELRIQAAVPTSSGLANSTSELETASSLLSANVKLESNWATNFSTKLSYSLFQFSHLSSQMATDSIQRGNSVIRLNTNSSVFAYGVSGNELVFELDYSPVASIDIKTKTTFIKNYEAPTKLNQGYFFSIAPGFKMNSNYILRPILEKYRVEADAMVAIFSDTDYGRTNRDGERFGFSIETKKYNLKLLAAESKLIQNNPFQSADKSFFLTLELTNLPI